MVTLRLPAYLISRTGDCIADASRALHFNAGPWAAVVAEIRTRYPELAERVLTESGPTPGFALVLNDEVLGRNYQAPELRDGDELCILATLAGG